MTKPRLIEPGTYHHITRRCVGRQFLLRPDPAIRNLFVYCFAEGSHRFGVQVLRLTLMSNHYHANVFDRDGKLPAFLEWVHLAELHATRPAWMSERSGPPKHTLRIHTPQHFVPHGWDENAYHDRLAERDAEAERMVRASLRAQGNYRFRGSKKAMAKSPTSSPKTSQTDSKRSPSFVAVTQTALLAIKHKLKSFYHAYKDALDRFRSGDRDTCFPPGTWKMSRALGCNHAA